jgi:hypothetical protein
LENWIPGIKKNRNVKQCKILNLMNQKINSRGLHLTEVEVHRRRYSLAILIILILFCWPAALIYYFTRPVTVERKRTRTCLGCGRQIDETFAVCPHCGKKVEP